MNISVQLIIGVQSHDIGFIKIKGKHIIYFTPKPETQNKLTYFGFLPVNRFTSYNVRFLNSYQEKRYNSKTLNAVITQTIEDGTKYEMYCSINLWQKFYLRTVNKQGWWWNDIIIKRVYVPLLLILITGIVTIVTSLIVQKLSTK